MLWKEYRNSPTAGRPIWYEKNLQLVVPITKSMICHVFHCFPEENVSGSAALKYGEKQDQSRLQFLAVFQEELRVITEKCFLFFGVTVLPGCSSFHTTWMNRVGIDDIWNYPGGISRKHGQTFASLIR